MKKIIIAILTLVILSCSKSDDSQSDPREAYFLEAIIGLWSYDTVKLNDELFLYQHTEGCERDLFQFYNEEGKEFDFEELVVFKL